MMRLFGLLCLCCSLVGTEASHHHHGKKHKRDKAFAIVVQPAWDDTNSYVHHVPWLKEFKIIKININKGSSFTYMHTHAGADFPAVDLYREYTYDADAPNAQATADWLCPQLKKLDVDIEAFIPSSDPNVHVADLLSACYGTPGNPSTGPLAEARRDKWVMGEAVKHAGLRSVLQTKVSTWNEAKSFLETWDPPLSEKRPCVFKILEGVAGNGVYKVTSMEQAAPVFQTILDGQTDLKGFNVMVQEFLAGREYAVDSVSRNGVHKVVAVWFEDFRGANGIFDQYFGFVLMNPEDELTKTIIAYGAKVLDALGLKNGAANTEIKFLDAEQQPCLVEVNARWAGVNFHDALAVENACTGNNQFAATFQAYLDKDAFDAMPAVRPISQYGAAWMAINYENGILRSIPGMDAAKKMKSFYNYDVQVHIGAPLLPTTPSGIPASVALVGDKATVDADYKTLIDMTYAKTFFEVVKANTFLAGDPASGPGASLLVLLSAFSAGAMVVGMVLMIARKRDPSEDELEYASYIAVE